MYSLMYLSGIAPKKLLPVARMQRRYVRAEYVVLNLTQMPSQNLTCLLSVSVAECLESPSEISCADHWKSLSRAAMLITF